MEILLAILIQWLAVNTDIQIDEYPSVKIVSEEYLHKEFGSPVYAFYNYSTKTVYISNKVDLSSHKGKSILVHELVHHYQNISGLRQTYLCIAESERLAYTTQKKYLLYYKAPLMKELGEFNIIMRSICDDHTL